MKKINYLLVLLALILAGCSGNSSTNADNGDSSPAMSSSIGVVPEMSSPASSSSDEGTSATSSTTNPSSTGGTSSTNTSSGTQTSSGSSSSSTVVSNAPIALYKIGGLAKTLNVTGAMSAIPHNIDLDTIYGTTGFSFLIKNNGTSDITGLKFDFDLDYFKVTPDSIITLGAPSTATGIEQLIKVTVEHGTLASGYGFADVLTGNQYGTLTISGKNADGPFSVTYTMHVYAKRMIINIDLPDTVMYLGNWYTTKPPFTSATLEYRTAYRYAHVDPSSEDCYLNMGEITLDTSTNIAMTDMKDYYKNFYKEDDLNASYDPTHKGKYTLVDSSATGLAKHAKLFTQLNGAKRLETYNYMDNNCVVLVNDNWPITNASTSVTNWVTTQRILN